MLTQTTALAPDGRPWQQVTLRNKSGMTVTVADWGATLLSADEAAHEKRTKTRCA